MKSHKHRPYFWRRVVSVALCVVLLSANMMEVSAAEELMRDEPLIEEERQSAESVSPGADATEELLESSNVDGQEETDTLPNIEEQPETVGAEMCKHHMEHDETCGYTEGNPVCSFICPICPVEEQIDAVLALLEQTEELDEEGIRHAAPLRAGSCRQTGIRASGVGRAGADRRRQDRHAFSGCGDP